LRLPRDLSGKELARQLAIFSYQVTRQTGSHIRLTYRENNEHHITIPNHEALRVGTLNGILLDVSEHLKISKEELIQRLWNHPEN
jgi:predicted RNA binding protein YcfA (HicA-like mRNA interferase family)